MNLILKPSSRSLIPFSKVAEPLPRPASSNSKSAGPVEPTPSFAEIAQQAVQAKRSETDANRFKSEDSKSSNAKSVLSRKAGTDVKTRLGEVTVLELVTRLSPAVATPQAVQPHSQNDSLTPKTGNLPAAVPSESASSLSFPAALDLPTSGETGLLSKFLPRLRPADISPAPVQVSSSAVKQILPGGTFETPSRIEASPSQAAAVDLVSTHKSSTSQFPNDLTPASGNSSIKPDTVVNATNEQPTNVRTALAQNNNSDAAPPAEVSSNNSDGSALHNDLSAIRRLADIQVTSIRTTVDQATTVPATNPQAGNTPALEGYVANPPAKKEQAARVAVLQPLQPLGSSIPIQPATSGRLGSKQILPSPLPTEAALTELKIAATPAPSSSVRNVNLHRAAPQAAASLQADFLNSRLQNIDAPGKNLGTTKEALGSTEASNDHVGSSHPTSESFASKNKSSNGVADPGHAAPGTQTSRQDKAKREPLPGPDSSSSAHADATSPADAANAPADNRGSGLRATLSALAPPAASQNPQVPIAASPAKTGLRDPQAVLDSTPLPAVPGEAATDGTLGAASGGISGAMRHNPGMSELRLNLKTDAFGRIDLHTVIEDNRVGVVLRSERGDLRGALGTEAGRFDANLQHHDLRLQDFLVTQHKTAVSMNFGEGQNPTPGRQGQSERSFFRGADSSRSALAGAMRPAVAVSTRPGGVGLSLHV